MTEEIEIFDCRQQSTSVTDVKQESKPKSETWKHSAHFLMSCIAMSVGLGNVWRFPFAAYENGGGAFLIPYLIVLALAARPVYYLEMCLGQFTSKRNINMFESLAPALKGIGFGQIFVTICVSTYYSSVMAITLHYLLHSFTFNLPWTECKSKWDEPNFKCLPSGGTQNRTVQNETFVSSSELWFTKEVLKEKIQINDGIGWPDEKLGVFLFISWLLLFLITSKGMKNSGKASYFFAIAPYVIMFSLLLRAVTLEGSFRGIIYFLKPQWEKLFDARVWYNALTQCFYSFNIGGGTVIMLSSYNEFKHNIYRDTLIITALDTIASFLAGITTFGILGNLAHELNVDVTQVVSSGGSRLAFITYPDAIAKFNTVPWLFSILFFAMLFTLGFGSLISLQGNVSVIIKDIYPSLKNHQVALITTLGGFLISLVYVTPGGQFILTFVDYYGVTFIFFILTTVEVIIVVWFYGINNFCSDVEFMIGKKVGFYWKLCWSFITPFALIGIFIYFAISTEKLKYGNYRFPNYVLNLGWFLSSIGICQPLIWYLVYLYKYRHSNIKQAISDSFSFTNWGPKDPVIYKEWKLFKNERVNKPITNT